MEFWMVVAAAGVGYVTQFLQSSSENKDNLLDQKQFSEISTHEQSDNKNLLYKLREKVCPFRRLARKRAQKEVSNEGAFRFRQLNLDSSEKLSSMDSTDHVEMSKTKCWGLFNSTGVPNGMTLLYMGITSGMISAIIANKREIENLNEKLKCTKNLVEDLQEELEMKEKLIMRDLANEKPNLYSPSMSMSSSCDIQVDEPTTQTSEHLNHLEGENYRKSSMSEIEAELEAELERLEMNMKVSSLERIYDLVELDPEDEVDVARGDLKLDSHNLQCPGSSESDWDSSETTRIDHSGPVEYPVSPWELSLRLHEVIESRLQAQIKELETALYNSQNRVCSLEGQQVFTQKYYASSESESSGYSQSPHCYHEADEDE